MTHWTDPETPEEIARLAAIRRLVVEANDGRVRTAAQIDRLVLLLSRSRALRNLPDVPKPTQSPPDAE